ncbi:MAG: protease pro-enzyme activation domain-containing protein [Terriglobia bacterium]|jgi:hypothetical protein
MRRKTIIALNLLALLWLVFLPGRISCAQSPQQDRISRPIAGSPAVWLEGNVRPMVQPENDMGPAEGSLKLENISLMFKLTASQQADLTELLAEQQDPSSPNYHHWLRPEQYADRFGLSPNDIKQVVAWLQSQGFTITQTARGRTWVSFSGTAAQVQAAFQTEIHNFSFHGQTYFANASEPAVPAALADVVLGVRGLDNYRLKPRSRVRHVKAEPDFTSAISGNTFVAPGDFAVVYDVANLYNAGIDGTNQTVAVMGQTDLYDSGSDVTAFRSAAGLPANSPKLELDPNSTDPGLSSGDIEEASLDVEWAGAVAKNATIIYFYSTDVINYSLYDAIDKNIAPVISISYGECEANWGSTPLSTLAQNAQRANSQGQTIVAAAGDSGAADCDVPPANSTSVVTTAMHGLAVDAPASVPYVTGMGGTEFNEGSGLYWQAATSVTGDIITSALSYIPEMGWNDTLSPVNTQHELLAGGGGVSSYFTTKPTWQTGPGVPSDNARDVPDLSLNSSPVHEALLTCLQGSCVNGFRDANQDLTVVGGTSAAAPTFAGIVALINQQHVNTPPGQGNINPILYPMAQYAPAAFHDITTGNNMVPCEVGSPNCPTGGEIGYSAGVGYDQVTGLGSVDAYNLVMEWDSTTAGLPAATLTAPANGATGVALTPAFSWSAVSGNNGYRIMIATSPADLTTNPGTSTCSACTIVDTTKANSSSYTPASALAAGTYFWQVQAIEPSSSTGLAAWSEIFSFTTAGATLAAPTLSAPANGATAVSVTPTFTWTSVTGSTGYRILIAAVQSALPTNSAVGTCGGCAVGTTTTGTSYTPSASALVGGTTYYWEVQALAPSGQNADWSSVFSFTTAAPDFSLSVSPTSLTIAPGANGTSTLTLTPINNIPTSSVTFTCSTGTLTGVTCSVGTLGANDQATVTITASSTARGFPAFPRNPRFGAWWVAGVALLCLLLIALSRLRRGGVPAAIWIVRHVALGAVLAALLLASLSCGSSGGGGGGGSTSPQPESGTVTVTGTSTSTTHNAQISVTVS